MLHAAGHAGYAPGRDIVCAAISALLQTLYAGLCEICRSGAAMRQKEGELTIAVYKTAENRREIHAVFQSILLGLRLLERDYPAYIELRTVQSSGGVQGDFR